MLVDTYARAERFLPWNAEQLVFGMLVEPHWIADADGEADRFWYGNRTRLGTEFVLVDARRCTRAAAFDHARLAASLSAASGTPYAANELPFDSLEFAPDEKSIQFDLGTDARWVADLATYACRLVERPAKLAAGEVRSPDDRWVAFAREGNLFLREAASGQEVALTRDGNPARPYATPLPSPLEGAGIPSRDPTPISVLWSPDSRRLLSYRIDPSGAGQYYLVQSTPLDGSRRPILHSYAYPLPGDEQVPTAELVVFDVTERTQRPLQVTPVPLLYYGGPIRAGSTWWDESGEQVYLLSRSRGNQSLWLTSIDARTGEARRIVEEHAETPVDPHLTSAGTPNVRVFDKGSSLLWFSQRDGWGHLYLYDARTGELKRQLTSGNWAVADVLVIDEAERWVSFSAVGRENGLDPYFELVYRVHLDGGEPQLLTPEDATHRAVFSPSAAVFVDAYSRTDQPPTTVLRAANGTTLLELERADVELLQATGWSAPERFCVKARDGMTDLYGVLIRPSTFDPGRKLPVLDDIYAGPQTNRAPASFAGYTPPGYQQPSQATRGFWHAQALAELGFAVVMIDGLGMPIRSKALHDRSFREVGDGGIEDHVVALQQLAVRHPYLDLERVGIYGHSAGGYASAHAMLRFPGFFKVAVSSAGNHDHRLDKASWIERYMGLPLGDYYRDQANSTLAANLQGKLLLIHGEMDENVHVASTLQLVDALVKANKDFDLLILPNRPHGCTDDPYFIRRRWDYFVRHLLGSAPPTEYRIAGPS